MVRWPPTAAGLALLHPGTTVVALLAADLPLLTRPAVGVLLDALAAESGPGAGRRLPPRRPGAAAAVVRGVAGAAVTRRAGPA